jgi:Na+-driven multidrug efflux pump
MFAMRAVFSFFSMLALGLMIAAIIMLGATGGANGPARFGMASPYLDYMSVVIGLGVGLVIATIAMIPWSELPQRLAGVLIAHWRRLRLLGLGAVFAAVLFYF